MPDESLTREVFGNIDAVSRAVFYALAAGSGACFAFGVYRRVRLWRLGRETGNKVEWRATLTRFITNVMSQRTLRTGRRWAGAAHLLLFSGFVVLFIGTLLIAVEHYAAAALGRDVDKPLFHKGLYFAIYEVVLDTAGIAMLVGCVGFIHRRWRSTSSISHTWLDWVVLWVLALICVTGYLTEGLRIIREQTPQPALSYVGLAVARLFQMLVTTRGSAAAIHFGLWWIHAVLALGLIAAFPYTRLLHSIAGAISVATRSETPGVMTPISIEEVEETGRVRVGRVQDFSRRQLLTLDACVSCGRCQDACPAYEAGKPLSPRDVVQDIRAHLNEVGCALFCRTECHSVQNGLAIRPTSLPSLIGDTIAAETAWSCTTCHACVYVCPLGVNPLGFITDMRRNLVGDGHLRGAPATALQRMQRSGNPWGLPADERFNWARGLDVPIAAEANSFEVLYWVGCAAAYDRRVQKVARAVVKLLRAASVNFAVLGPEERCTGESARRMGEEFLFQELAQANLETLDRYHVKKIVTHCPHCLNSFKNDYSQLGGRFEVMHHTQLLAQLADEGRLLTGTTSPGCNRKLTYHDPCYLARVNDVMAAPRRLIDLCNTTQGDEALIEMPRHGRQTSCCGAGGGRMWFDDAPDGRVGAGRVKEALETGADTVAVSCPFCLIMISDGVAAQNSHMKVKDVAELLAETLDTDGAA